MSTGTKIQWTQATWQVTAGCSRVSEGCGGASGGGCYAERMAHRLGSNPQTPQYHGLTRKTSKGPRWTGEVRLLPERLSEPLRWRKPRRVFVDSMSDLFHEDVPDEYIAAVFGVMAACPQHTFQVLTKRPQRAAKWFEWLHARGWGKDAAHWWVEECIDYAIRHAGDLPKRRDPFDGLPHDWPLPNVWLGTSVEDQATADERIPHLLQCPAAVRFVSYEPALGPVDFTPYLVDDLHQMGRAPRMELDWIIVGGESGPGARPFDVQWARDTIAQCRAAGVPCFVKQLGPYYEVGVRRIRWRDPKGGNPEEWPADLRVREFPEVST